MLNSIELHAVSLSPLSDETVDHASTSAAFGDSASFAALARNCVGYAARNERPWSDALLLAEVFARMAAARDGVSANTLLAGVLIWRHNLIGGPSEPDQADPLIEALVLLEEAAQAGDALAIRGIQEYASIASAVNAVCDAYARAAQPGAPATEAPASETQADYKEG